MSEQAKPWVRELIERATASMEKKPEPVKTEEPDPLTALFELLTEIARRKTAPPDSPLVATVLSMCTEEQVHKAADALARERKYDQAARLMRCWRGLRGGKLCTNRR